MTPRGFAKAQYSGPAFAHSPRKPSLQASVTLSRAWYHAVGPSQCAHLEKHSCDESAHGPSEPSLHAMITNILCAIQNHAPSTLREHVRVRYQSRLVSPSLSTLPAKGKRSLTLPNARAITNQHTRERLLVQSLPNLLQIPTNKSSTDEPR